MYIPISIPLKLPQYVQLDRSSRWHTSAMLSTALETMTLPSRLRYSSRRHVTFDTMEAALNVNGTQCVANLECSVVDPWDLEAEKSRSVQGSHDHRRPGTRTSDLMLDEDGPKVTTANLDMNFSCWGNVDSVMSLSQRHKTTHTFGQVESVRGELEEHEEEDDEEAGFARKTKRLANLAIIEKSVFHLSAFLIGDSSYVASQGACTLNAFCRANHRIPQVSLQASIPTSG